MFWACGRVLAEAEGAEGIELEPGPYQNQSQQASRLQLLHAEMRARTKELIPWMRRTVARIR